MRTLPTLLLATLVVLTAGCRSAPNNYHTLVAAQPNHAAGEKILVERFSMPPQVDRPQLVIRQGTSSLVILETEWWGANLVDEFRSALQDQLGGPVGGTPRALLRVDVQRFDSVPGQYALLEAVWRLKRPGQDEINCRTSVQTPAQNSVGSLVGAQQANLQKLASAVRASASGCPRS